MAVPAMAQNLTDLSTLCRAGGLRARQEIRCAFWREGRAGRCKAPRRRRCGDIVQERQRRRCPPAAAPLRACGPQASSKMYTLFPDGPLVSPRRREGAKEIAKDPCGPKAELQT